MAKKKQLSQSDVHAFTLDEALRIPKAIIDNYASEPTPPIKVAKVFDVSPNTGSFKMQAGASVAYGLTEGGARASSIKLRPLAQRILKPTVEGDVRNARVEALLTPIVINKFLTRYNGSKLPSKEIALNVLADMGVPDNKQEGALELILKSARTLGLIFTTGGHEHVDLSNIPTPTGAELPSQTSPSSVSDPSEAFKPTPEISSLGQTSIDLQERKRRVFIAHGEDKEMVDTIKGFLEFGELEAVISAKQSTVSQPVSDKVMSDMRSCGASIIHVADEHSYIDREGKTHNVLNPNVLIEIGASMALYGSRYILLVKDGVKLPSNLQGLFEVRYSGDSLDHEATLNLLGAIKDIKNHELPSEIVED